MAKITNNYHTPIPSPGQNQPAREKAALKQRSAGGENTGGLSLSVPAKPTIDHTRITTAHPGRGGK